MDSATTGTGVDGNEYVYYLAHPSEIVKPELGLVDNYAAKIAVPTKADLTYTLNVTLLQYQPPTGPVQTTGLTAADVQRLVMEASSLWEQVGVRFNLGTTTTLPATTVVGEWDLPNDDDGTVTAVTTKSRA